MDIFLSKNNDIIKDISKNIKHNTYSDYTFVDDLFSLSLVKKHNIKIDTLIYTNDVFYQDETQNLLDSLKKTSQNIYSVSKKTMDSMVLKENSVGIIAKTKLNDIKLNDLRDCSFLVIGDHIELPGNLGTIIRSADACGVDAYINVDGITKLNNPKLVHSSRGMILVKKNIENTYEETLNFLLANGFRIFLGEPVLGKSFIELNYDGKIAIVIGSERFGINPDWYNHPHEKVFIPMDGEMTSLNVGVAASILMYKAREKRNKK